LDNYLPEMPWRAEWVGGAVLVLCVAAGWSIFRGATAGPRHPKVQFVGIAAIGALTVGMWIGIAMAAELGAVLLASGGGLSVWAVLLRLGLTWRNHVRPTMVPAFLAVLAAVFGWYQPTATTVVLLLILIWARRTRRAATARVDQQMNILFTRIQSLTHVDAASYVVEIWLARYRAKVDDIELLALVERSRERSAILPRARCLAISAYSVRLLTKLADEAVDERLRTDRAAVSRRSWIRVLTRVFLHQLLQRTGIIPIAKLFTGLVLAIPPARRNSWFGEAERNGQEVAKPNPHTYVADLTMRLPSIPEKQDMDAVQDQVRQDAARAGPVWLAAVAARAEQYRQEGSTSGGNRAAMLCEAIWSVHEEVLSARPEHCDVFDQLRVQLPDLLADLSIQGMSIDKERGCLIITLSGVPKTFDELSSATNGSHAPYGAVVETRDRREWVLRRLETAVAEQMHMVFAKNEVWRVAPGPVASKDSN
jgi:hypothetical protein